MDVFQMAVPNERAERGPKKGMRKDLSLAPWNGGWTNRKLLILRPLSSERRSSSLHTLHPLNGAHIARGNILHGDGILKLRAKGSFICDVLTKTQK